MFKMRLNFVKIALLALQELHSLQQCVCSCMFCNQQFSCSDGFVRGVFALCGIRCVARLLCLLEFVRACRRTVPMFANAVFASSFAPVHIDLSTQLPLIC